MAEKNSPPEDNNNLPELVLHIPGSESRRGKPLFPIPVHLVGKSATYIGSLKQRDDDEAEADIVREKIPEYPDGTKTVIKVGPKNAYTEEFEFDQKLLMEESHFFRAIYRPGGKIVTQ